MIKSIAISGHAGSDEYGKDLVCASVSTLVISSINALKKIVKAKIKYTLKSGNTDIEVLETDKEKLLKADIILRSFELAVINLEKEYNEFIKVKIKE